MSTSRQASPVDSPSGCPDNSRRAGPVAQASAPGLPASDAVRRTRVRVRYAETDRMGVVYYANYLVWFEVGRTEWLRQTGWTYSEMERDGISLPVIEAHCEYRQSARYDDEVEIATLGALVTPVRIRFDYAVTRGAEGAVASVGHTVHAAVDIGGKPCRLPGRILEMLA